MRTMCRGRSAGPVWLALICLANAAGCAAVKPAVVTADISMPRELAKVSLPEYIIEPPDLIQIDAVRLIPKPPYRIEPLDVLDIVAKSPRPDAPLAGPITVEPDGTINLGPVYGTIKIAGKTIPEAKAAIEAHLKNALKDPEVSVIPARTRALQQIQGEHLVNQDGSISLGSYGDVRVIGMTRAQARAAIERHLSVYMLDPEVAVTVTAFNSKFYYVIFDGGGVGQQVFRLSITGNETVLDAISQVNGLGPVASKRHIWVARPAPPECGTDQILPVDWNGITTKGRTVTNYQLLPGDRLFVKAYPMVAFDNTLARITAPFERALGFSLLGTGAIQSFQQLGSNNPNGFGGFP